MNTLKKGNAGKEVSHLQELLTKKGYLLPIDGSFGTQTHLAVCKFQKDSNLKADGIVGTTTWNALLGNKNTTDNSEKKLIQPPATAKDSGNNNIDFAQAAKALNIEEAAIRAVHQVEAGGKNGFFDNGRPMILFEGHIFWRQLEKRSLKPQNYVSGNEDILFPKWDKSKYKGGVAEYGRLERACNIHKDSALCSASWGMFQIMGFNHSLCGYDSVSKYVEAMESNSNNQLMAFIEFLKNTKMDIPLRNLDWAKFAEKYNGPAYKQNRYDEKLAAAYKKYKTN